MSGRKPISKGQRFRILQRDGFKCVYCGATPPTVVLHIDHKIPVVRGGQNTDDNLVTACLPCNIGKGAGALISGSRIIRGAGQAMERPKIEFFWQREEERPYKMKRARCIEWDEHTLEYGGYEYRKLCSDRSLSTHGHSGMGFSPYEAAMYAVEILTADWVSFPRYLSYIDDLNLMAAAGHLPQYVAPHVLRGLHAEVVHSRCGEKPENYESLADAVAEQSIAAFDDFLTSQHRPWANK